MSGDIVLWYDDLEENNCVIENAVYLNRSILKKLTHNNIKFSVRQTSEELDNSKTNVYVIELHNVHAGVDIFYISKHSKKFKKHFNNLINSLPKNELSKNFVFNDFYTDFKSEEQSLLNNRL